MLNWKPNEDSFEIDLKQGKAVVQVIKRGNSKIYLPRIEDKNGNIIAAFEPGFEDFETADAFISANLIELDRIGVDDIEFRKGLVSVLDMCASFFMEPNRIFHLRRLESIKGWLNNQAANYDTSNLPQTNWSNYIFNWHQNGIQNWVEVAPHGIASIIEDAQNSQSNFRFGSANDYYVQIEDPTGITLRDPYYSSGKDFAAAEARLREILTELEQPFVDESYLDYLSFTLQICRHLLPSDTDLMQYVRLSYIEDYLGEALP